MPNKRNCANCRFFDFQEGGPDEDGVDTGPAWGFCLRYAPRPSYPNPSSPRRNSLMPSDLAWPAVYRSDWCGEHEREDEEV